MCPFSIVLSLFFFYCALNTQQAWQVLFFCCFHYIDQLSQNSTDLLFYACWDIASENTGPNFMGLQKQGILCLSQAYFTGKRGILACARAYSMLLAILRLQNYCINLALAK